MISELETITTNFYLAFNVKKKEKELRYFREKNLSQNILRLFTVSLVKETNILSLVISNKVTKMFVSKLYLKTNSFVFNE